MNLHSRFLIGFILLLLILCVLQLFRRKRLSAGQALFWLLLLAVADIMALFPALIDKLQVVWGNLVAVSWISFAGLTVLIFYMFYVTVRQNELHRQMVSLSRQIALLDNRLRRLENRSDADTPHARDAEHPE